MKNLYLVFFILMLSSQLVAQILTSKDNTIGNWKTSGTWVGNAVPGNNGEANSSVHIYGKVTLEDNLILDNNNQSEVYDTLWVQGDLTIHNGSSLTIKSGAILFVSGTLFLKEGTINNQGVVAIDHYDIRGGSLNNNDHAFYIFSFANNYYRGNGSINSNVDFGDENDFENDHKGLYDQIANGTLPIKLLSFTGTAQSNAVQLDWITVWEENFDFFTIERAGSDLQFKAIGTLQGNGNTEAEMAYAFTDKYPLSGQAFYRLKATDFDGSVEYHKIISVYFNGFSTSETKVYPNPVNNYTFKIETAEASAESVKLLDMSGRLVFSQAIQTGINEIHLPETIKPGAYVLILVGSQEKQHQQRIMIL